MRRTKNPSKGWAGWVARRKGAGGVSKRRGGGTEAPVTPCAAAALLLPRPQTASATPTTPRSRSTCTTSPSAWWGRSPSTTASEWRPRYSGLGSGHSGVSGVAHVGRGAAVVPRRAILEAIRAPPATVSPHFAGSNAPIRLHAAKRCPRLACLISHPTHSTHASRPLLPPATHPLPSVPLLPPARPRPPGWQCFILGME